MVLAVILAGWFLLIAPKRSTASDLEAQTATQVNANQQLQTQITVLKQQSKDLPKKEAELAALNTKIPSSTALPSLIRGLSAAAASAGVDLTSLTPSAPAPLTTPGTTGTTTTPTTGTTSTSVSTLSQITLQVQASGGYFQLQQFFNQLERLDRAFLVTNALFAEADPSSTSTSSTQTTQPSANTLTATITAQVFVAPTPGAAGTTAASPPAGSTSTTTSQ